MKTDKQEQIMAFHQIGQAACLKMMDAQIHMLEQEIDKPNPIISRTNIEGLVTTIRAMKEILQATATPELIPINILIMSAFHVIAANPAEIRERYRSASQILAGKDPGIETLAQAVQDSFSTTRH